MYFFLTAYTQKSVFRGVAQILTEISELLVAHRPDDGGNKFLRKVSQYLPDYSFLEDSIYQVIDLKSFHFCCIFFFLFVTSHSNVNFVFYYCFKEYLVSVNQQTLLALAGISPSKGAYHSNTTHKKRTSVYQKRFEYAISASEWSEYHTVPDIG